MRSLNLFLSFEEPQVDFSRACKDIVGCTIKVYGSQSVFRAIANLIKDSLNACIGPDVPNLHNFISTQTDQMVPIFIQSKILHGCVMSVQIGESTQCEGVPHNNVSFFTATRDEPVF